jgi:hypothetical protein
VTLGQVFRRFRFSLMPLIFIFIALLAGGQAGEARDTAYTGMFRLLLFWDVICSNY